MTMCCLCLLLSVSVAARFCLPRGRLAFKNYACMSGIVTYKTRLKKDKELLFVGIFFLPIAFVSYLKLAFQPQNRAI